MSMTTITPDHLYFITATVWQPKNKLQIAIIESVRQYKQQILHSSPESLAVTIVDAISTLNNLHTRCKPEEVTLRRAYGITEPDEPIYITIGENVAQLKITPVMGEMAL